MTKRKHEGKGRSGSTKLTGFLLKLGWGDQTAPGDGGE